MHDHWKYELTSTSPRAFCQGLRMHCAEHLAQCLILQCQISALHLVEMQTEGVSANLIELAWAFEVETQQMHLSRWELLFRTHLSMGGKATVLARCGHSRGLSSARHCLPDCRYKAGLRHKLGLLPAWLCCCWVEGRGAGPAVPSPPSLHCAATELVGDFEVTRCLADVPQI